jgi:hypothetical protein
LNCCFRADFIFRVGALLFPREFFSAAQIEELEGTLRTAAGRDVSLESSDSIVVFDWGERESWRGEVHMSQVLGDDQSVVPY